jgi:iron-sulfur cluster assembly accessory protein
MVLFTKVFLIGGGAQTILQRFITTIASRVITDSSGKEMGIELTRSAVHRLQTIYKDDPSRILRVAVDSGGCHGLTYSFKLVPHTTSNDDEDIVYRDAETGVGVVVDALSLPYIDGGKVDFEETFMRSAFVIKDNPQAGSECGCGSSFDITRR